LNRIEDDARRVFFTEFRADEHVVKVRIIPVAAEVHSDMVGAPLIDRANQALNVFRFWHAPPYARDSLAEGSVNEDVKGVLAILQNTLGAATNDHAITLGVRLRDHGSLQRGHSLSVNNLIVDGCCNTLEGAAPQGIPADAVQPGIYALVVALRQLRFHLSGQRSAFD
jgi:hypothetical protein